MKSKTFHFVLKLKDAKTRQQLGDLSIRKLQAQCIGNGSSARCFITLSDVIDRPTIDYGLTPDLILLNIHNRNIAPGSQILSYFWPCLRRSSSAKNAGLR